MRSRPVAGAARPIVVVVLTLSTQSAVAQEAVPLSTEQPTTCVEIAGPATKAAEVEMRRMAPAEVQKQLQALLERFAARPEVPMALGCLLRQGLER